MDHSDSGGPQQVEPTAGSPRTSKARHGHVGVGAPHMVPQKQQYRQPMQHQHHAMIFAQHPYGPAMMAYPAMGSQFGMPVAQYPMGPQYPPQLSMVPPGAGFPPQQQQAQFMGRVPQMSNTNNLFYKTRMCNKWRTGACPFGDKCTYAHGQHEIRRVPAEVVAAHAMQIQHTEMNEGAYKQGNVSQQNNGSIAARKEPQQQGDDQQQNKSQLYYKTRLCIRFMQSGYCVKGNECTFAHGYEDLRLLGSSQQNRHAAQRTNDNDSKDVEEEDRRAQEPITEEQARARAMSAIAGVGHAENAMADPEKIKEATAALEDGSAFEGSPYSDSASK